MNRTVFEISSAQHSSLSIMSLVVNVKSNILFRVIKEYSKHNLKSCYLRVYITKKSLKLLDMFHFYQYLVSESWTTGCIELVIKVPVSKPLLLIHEFKLI